MIAKSLRHCKDLQYYDLFYIKQAVNGNYDIIGHKNGEEKSIRVFSNVEEAKNYLIDIQQVKIMLEREKLVPSFCIPPSYHSPYNHTHYRVGRNDRLKKAERCKYRKLKYF